MGMAWECWVSRTGRVVVQPSGIAVPVSECGQALGGAIDIPVGEDREDCISFCSSAISPGSVVG